MIIYIEPKSLFPPLHSDTIFGAIIYAINQLYPGSINDLIEKFREPLTQPSFTVSSAFPFVKKEDEKVHFFPKPITEPVKCDQDNLKKYNMVKFIHEDIFREWLSGSLDEGSIINNIENYHVENGFLMEKGLDLNFKMENSTMPHNTINRVTGASENIFYSNGTVFKNMGLFFMVKTVDAENKNLIISAMKFLRDRGFGGDVSTGKGQFDYELSHEELLEHGGNSLITLSRYIPTEDELRAFNNDVWFELGSKRGRSADGSLRKKVRFFNEGTTFPTLDKEKYGTLIDSGFEAVEYGLAYTAGIKEVNK